MEIKFIEYTGKHPNLCSGILTLEIDGKKKTFGWPEWGSTEGPDYPKFWRSGGYVYRDDNGDYHPTCGEWGINDEYLPNFLLPHIKELKSILNDNIPWGCCGGCG